jgi:very-short-patch-repair endonuclease
VLRRFARRLRRQQTDAEKKLWRLLRNRQCGGDKFRRQVEIDQYIADLACLDAKLIVEIDGGQHLDQLSSDAIRSRELESRGYVCCDSGTTRY